MGDDQLLDELLGRLTIADGATPPLEALGQSHCASSVGVPATMLPQPELQHHLGQQQQATASKCMTQPLQAYLRQVTACRSATEELMAVIGELVRGQVSFLSEGGGESQMREISELDARVRMIAASTTDLVEKLNLASAERLRTLGEGVACTEMRIRANLDASLQRRIVVCQAAYDEAVARFTEGMSADGWVPPSQPNSCMWTWSPT